MAINWGILSTGNIATKFTEDFQYAREGNIVSVASRNYNKANEFAKKYNIKNAYGSYEALAQDPEVDAIYIGSPHNHHCEHAILCMENGKSVLCEKPMAVNSRELESMIQTAQSNNVLLMEAMWMYFLPPILQVKEWIEEGRIGEIKLLKANFGFGATFNPESRLFNPNLAGGALLDIGIYPIAFALEMIDQPVEKILAEGHIGSTKVDEYDAVTLRFKDQSLAQLMFSIATPMKDEAWIYGTKGYIYVPDFWRATHARVVQDNDDTENFKDTRQALGYNFEADEINHLLKQKKTESDTMPHQKSRTLISTMDEIRSTINLKYPFE